jgi:hypothetical protein
MIGLKASQVYENGSWCILINGVEVWRDGGGDNYPCEANGGAALNHMQKILTTAVRKFMKSQEK